MPVTIKLWFNKEYNLYFPKTSNDCKALLDAGWKNLPVFTPPGQVSSGINSVDQLYGYLSSRSLGVEFNLKLGNYLPSHIAKSRYRHTPHNSQPTSLNTQIGVQR